MEEILLAFTAKALNMNEDEIKETLESDGGLEALQSKYATHIKAQKDAGYKSAERKVNALWEGKISNTFNIQSDTKGTELLDEVKETVEAQSAPETPKELTEAQLKKLPYVMNLEKQVQEIGKTAEEKWQKVLSEKEEAWQQKELFGQVKDKGLQIFESLKPILSEDPNRAAAQKNIFLRELENYKYMVNEGQIILLDRETGERKNNDQGYPIKFDDVVKNITTQYFDLQVSEKRASTGRKTDDQTTLPPVTVPKTREEYAKFLDSDATPEVKQQVMEQYYSQS